MSFSVVQAQYGSVHGSILEATFDSRVIDNHNVHVFIGYATSGSILSVKDSEGNAYSPDIAEQSLSNSSGYRFGRVYSAPRAKGSETNDFKVTVTFSTGDYVEMFIAEVDGEEASSFDVSASNSPASVTQDATTTSVSTNAADLVFGYFNTTQQFSADSGFTVPTNGNPGGASLLEYYVQGASGTAECTAMGGGAWYNGYGAILVAYKPATPSSWTYKRTFTVDHTQVGSSDLVNFPVKIYGTITEFKTAANGGHIQNTDTFNGQTVPADICFYSDSGLTSALKFEISYYEPSTGKIVIWVKSDLSHTSDAAIYCGYDDSGVTTYQGGAAGDAWESNFVRIYHLHNSGGSLVKVESTAAADALTTSNVNAQTDSPDGISGAFDYSPLNSSNAVGGTTFTLGTTAVTIEAWVKNNDNNANAMFVEKSNVNGSWELFAESTALKLRGGGSVNTLTATIPSQGAWHHLAGTISSTSGKIYIDAGTPSSGTVDAIGDTSTLVHLGSYDGAGYFANMFEVEVRVSKTARSADWITATYNSTKASSTFFSDGGESAVGGGTTYSNSVSLDATSATSTSGSATMPSSASAAATPSLAATPGTQIPTSSTLGATPDSSTSAGTQISVSISTGPTAALSAAVTAALEGASTLAASPNFVLSAILQAAASMSLDAVSGISESPAMDAEASLVLDATAGLAASLPASVYSSSISADATPGISFAASLVAEGSAAIGVTPAMVAQAAARLVAGASLSATPAIGPSSTATMRSAISIAIQSAMSAGSGSALISWLKALLGLSKPAMIVGALTNRPPMLASLVNAAGPMRSTALSVSYGAVNG